MGALKAAHLKGIDVPSGLSITGFGGYAMTDIVHPGLTTVKFQYEEAGRKAADGLVTILNGGKIPLSNMSEYRIIERGSVDNKLTK
jgi:LacI family sucrose operon transcriptional repressor